jgi:hypothetical protein
MQLVDLLGISQRNMAYLLTVHAEELAHARRIFNKHHHPKSLEIKAVWVTTPGLENRD